MGSDADGGSFQPSQPQGLGRRGFKFTRAVHLLVWPPAAVRPVAHLGRMSSAHETESPRTCGILRGGARFRRGREPNPGRHLQREACYHYNNGKSCHYLRPQKVLPAQDRRESNPVVSTLFHRAAHRVLPGIDSLGGHLGFTQLHFIWAPCQVPSTKREGGDGKGTCKYLGTHPHAPPLRTNSGRYGRAGGGRGGSRQGQKTNPVHTLSTKTNAVVRSDCIRLAGG